MQEPSVSFKSKVFRSSLKQQGSRALFCLLPRSCSGISRQTRRSISRLVTWSAACHLSEKFFLSVISLNSSPSLNSTGNFLKDPCKPWKDILIFSKTKIEIPALSQPGQPEDCQVSEKIHLVNELHRPPRELRESQSDGSSSKEMFTAGQTSNTTTSSLIPDPKDELGNSSTKDPELSVLSEVPSGQVPPLKQLEAVDLVGFSPCFIYLYFIILSCLF